MPFIRYNLHDSGSFTEKEYSCGRTFPLMNMICGYSDDYLVYDNRLKKALWDLWGYFLPLAKYIHEYQVIEEEMNSFKVLVVPS